MTHSHSEVVPTPASYLGGFGI